MGYLRSFAPNKVIIHRFAQASSRRISVFDGHTGRKFERRRIMPAECGVDVFHRFFLGVGMRGIVATWSECFNAASPAGMRQLIALAKVHL
jgi:hypothetical protein